jgi:hypothetical protein
MDVLGRSPDPSGQAFFSQELANNVPHRDVALQVVTSTEGF